METLPFASNGQPEEYVRLSRRLQMIKDLLGDPKYRDSHEVQAVLSIEKRLVQRQLKDFGPFDVS